MSSQEEDIEELFARVTELEVKYSALEEKYSALLSQNQGITAQGITAFYDREREKRAAKGSGSKHTPSNDCCGVKCPKRCECECHGR